MGQDPNASKSSKDAFMARKLRIAGVEAFALAKDTSQGPLTGREELCLVRVVTECGRSGWGEVHSSASVVRAVVEAPKSSQNTQGLAVLLTGQTIDDPRRLWRLMYDGTSWFGRDGAALHAIAGVDLALWDLIAQEAGAPIWRCLRILSNYDQPAMAMPVYASGKSVRSPRETAERLKFDLLAGFRDVKIGGPPFGSDVDNDLACLEVARTVIGYRARLMVDLGQTWDPETTLERAQAFRHFELAWIEDPLDRDDLEGQARLTGSRTPIAAGKAEATQPAFERLLNTEGVDVLQINVSRTGFTTGVSVALEASRRGVLIATHSQTSAFNLQASLHFLNAIPNALTMEYPRLQQAIWQDLARPPSLNSAGHIAPPSDPGLGIAPDPSVMQQSLVA